MEFIDFGWISMDLVCIFYGFHGCRVDFHGSGLDFLRISLIWAGFSMEFLDFEWISMDPDWIFYGFHGSGVDFP